MAIFDANSFLAGIQVGRRLKAWDAAREREQEQTEESDEQEDEPSG